jgi:hypothetical protein
MQNGYCLPTSPLAMRQLNQRLKNEALVFADVFDVECVLSVV